jgi:hypothetical protein
MIISVIFIVKEKMANFVLLYSEGSMPQSDAEQKAVLQDWEAWFAKLGKDLVDGGNPFAPMAKTIGGDGKVSNDAVGGMARGYSVIKADALDAAVAAAKSCMVLKGGAKITVTETFSAMGM